MPFSQNLSKSVRISTDLSPASYRFLISLCGSLALLTGRARVPHSEAMRVLIGLLEEDAALCSRVTEGLVRRLEK